eukprot:2073697-Pyramimonas_sp.AAC.2
MSGLHMATRRHLPGLGLRLRCALQNLIERVPHGPSRAVRVRTPFRRVQTLPARGGNAVVQWSASLGTYCTVRSDSRTRAWAVVVPQL